MKGALIFSSVLMLANQGSPATASPDPVPNLVFYAVIGFAAILTMVDKAGSILERLRRRRAEEDGRSKGGLVTFEAHKADMAEVAKSMETLHALVGGAVTMAMHNKDVGELHRKLEDMDRARQERSQRMESSLSHVANDVAASTAKMTVIHELLMASGIFGPKPSSPH